MSSLDRLSELFMRFPGIGPKQAKRFVYFLLRESESYKRELIAAVDELKESGRMCASCFRFFSDSQSYTTCFICRDESRDRLKLLVVEKEIDADAIERTGAYNGHYFIIGGLIPLLSEKPSEFIRIRELVHHIHSKIESESLDEVIFAFPVTDQGDVTKEYVEKTLSQIVGAEKLKFSVLARGLSSGLELEYVDRDTFKSAFVGRIQEK